MVSLYLRVVVTTVLPRHLIWRNRARSRRAGVGQDLQADAAYVYLSPVGYDGTNEYDTVASGVVHRTTDAGCFSNAPV